MGSGWRLPFPCSFVRFDNYCDAYHGTFPRCLCPADYMLYSEKQSRSNSRWMRLISPSNNRRELVLLSRLAQTMAIHANPPVKQSQQYSACESPRPLSTYLLPSVPSTPPHQPLEPNDARLSILPSEGMRPQLVLGMSGIKRKCRSRVAEFISADRIIVFVQPRHPLRAAHDTSRDISTHRILELNRMPPAKTPMSKIEHCDRCFARRNLSVNELQRRTCILQQHSRRFRRSIFPSGYKSTDDPPTLR
ncbi:hypothetical protein PUN28_017352 [Cardiocondyla obscurior]|uniref:Uncharacterized protein n=1 Tax=Cardiocondyla obscurior TaxID=286306 RepID=A0AAW2ELF2_9HYME